MLLGLNCGFGQVEVGTLTLEEVFLDKRHPWAETLNYQTSDSDSFIRRVRKKTGKYVETKLWPHTVLAIKWQIERRQEQARTTPGSVLGENSSMDASGVSVLLTNENGRPIYRRSKGGGVSQDISSRWKRVTNRAATCDPSLTNRSFCTLRSTTADFLYTNFSPEIACLFLGHNLHPKLDPFICCPAYGRLFEALDEFAARLRPVFDTLPNPVAHFLQSDSPTARQTDGDSDGCCRRRTRNTQQEN
jgi:hypothetical protein